MGRLFVEALPVALANSTPASLQPVNPPAIPANTVPAKVTGLAGAQGVHTVSLSWTRPTNGGSVITDYAIRYRTSPAGSWNTFSDGTSAALTALVC